jgi:hypothetical protein
MLLKFKLLKFKVLMNWIITTSLFFNKDKYIFEEKKVYFKYFYSNNYNKIANMTIHNIMIIIKNYATQWNVDNKNLFIFDKFYSLKEMFFKIIITCN